MLYFCTLFDRRYLDRGVALYQSLAAQSVQFHLWILCMDQESETRVTALDLPNVTAVTVDELSRSDARVRAAKNNRSLVEFYFTTKSFFCAYVFGSHAEVDLLTYLDADMFFFGTPKAIGREMDGHSVGLTPHRFPELLRKSEQFGLFNAGFISFRRDRDGMACLSWWMDRCFEWCHDYVSEKRFADQGYLDRIPELFDNVRIIAHPGINLAPWNIAGHEIRQANGRILVDDRELILFHFHGMKRINSIVWDSGLANYRTVIPGRAKYLLYRPYLRQIMQSGFQSSVVEASGIRSGANAPPLPVWISPQLWKRAKVVMLILRTFFYRSHVWVDFSDRRSGIDRAGESVERSR